MRNLIAIFLLAASTVMVSAQESKDTIAVQELKEIVIEAPKVIHKADMDVYHLREAQLTMQKMVSNFSLT